MGTEIERKFIIDDPQKALYAVWGVTTEVEEPYLDRCILQSYINDNVRVRVEVDRNRGPRQVHYYLTIKSERQGIERKEFTIEIEEEQGKELLEEFKSNSVRKSRYINKYKGKVWEVDVFTENNYGLFLAEIELEDKDEEFEFLPGIGDEVTDDERYYNSNLAKNPYKNWSK